MSIRNFIRGSFSSGSGSLSNDTARDRQIVTRSAVTLEIRPVEARSQVSPSNGLVPSCRFTAAPFDSIEEGTLRLDRREPQHEVPPKPAVMEAAQGCKL